jgi:hypothetical protein
MTSPIGEVSVVFVIGGSLMDPLLESFESIVVDIDGGTATTCIEGENVRGLE